MATGANASGQFAAVWSASTDSPSNRLRSFSSTTGALLFDSGPIGAVARCATSGHEQMWMQVVIAA